MTQDTTTMPVMASDTAALVEVTQADRDAAAALIEAYWSGADAGMMKLAQSYRAGHSQGVFVRAFARHRLSAELAARSGWEQGQREGKAAVVSWLRERGAMKPRATLWQAAEVLADQFEQTERPAISSMEAPSHD